MDGMSRTTTQHLLAQRSRCKGMMIYLSELCGWLKWTHCTEININRDGWSSPVLSWIFIVYYVFITPTLVALLIWRRNKQPIKARSSLLMIFTVVSQLVLVLSTTGMFYINSFNSFVCDTYERKWLTVNDDWKFVWELEGGDIHVYCTLWYSRFLFHTTSFLPSFECGVSSSYSESVSWKAI